jgi:RNA-directed DNA polymerase
VRTRRQKIQLELAFPPTATGEARSGGAAGTEARAANAATERQAALGPSMEAIVERDNLRKALAQVRRNKGAPGIETAAIGFGALADWCWRLSVYSRFNRYNIAD